jgi:mono/diheme cytochrome c family protein
MAIWVLVGFWVTVGLGVFLVALRGGGARRRARGARGGESRASRRGFVVVAAVVWLVFGVGVPALVLANNGEDKAKAAPGGVELTKAETNGRVLFAQNCATCHTLRGANAVGKVGPNLDQLRPPKALVVNAIEQGRARGNGQMPAGLLAGQDAADVAAFVGAVAGH